MYVRCSFFWSQVNKIGQKCSFLPDPEIQHTKLSFRYHLPLVALLFGKADRLQKIWSTNTRQFRWGWSNCDQIMIKIWPKYGQIMVKIWSNYDQNMIKLWSTYDHERKFNENVTYSSPREDMSGNSSWRTWSIDYHKNTFIIQEEWRAWNILLFWLLYYHIKPNNNLMLMMIMMTTMMMMMKHWWPQVTGRDILRLVHSSTNLLTSWHGAWKKYCFSFVQFLIFFV